VISESTLFPSIYTLKIYSKNRLSHSRPDIFESVWPISNGCKSRSMIVSWRQTKSEKTDRLTCLVTQWSELSNEKSS
jgi:hypothetical protein